MLWLIYFSSLLLPLFDDIELTSHMLHLQTLTQVKITFHETHFHFIYILIFYHTKIKRLNITNTTLRNSRFHIFLFLNERNNYDICKKMFKCCLRKVYIAVL